MTIPELRAAVARRKVVWRTMSNTGRALGDMNRLERAAADRLSREWRSLDTAILAELKARGGKALGYSVTGDGLNFHEEPRSPETADTAKRLWRNCRHVRLATEPTVAETLTLTEALDHLEAHVRRPDGWRQVRTGSSFVSAVDGAKSFDLTNLSPAEARAAAEAVDRVRSAKP